MSIKRKNIDLDEKIIEELTDQAARSPQKNFKRYVEQLLADKAMFKQLKEVQK